MPTERSPASAHCRRLFPSSRVALALIVIGCGGEPTKREVANARAFEALLTAVSLRNETEVEGDAMLIDDRHKAGELSEGNYRTLCEIIAKARAKDWGGAEKRAYEFRKQFGDRGSFFK
jgi:hypothetical protein